MPGIQKLTDRQIKVAKPKTRPYRLADGAALSLLVRPSGTKSWQFKYRLNGKENIHTYGTYPELSLAAVRDRHRLAHLDVSNGEHPAEAKRSRETTSEDVTALSLRAVAEEFLENNPKDVSAGHLHHCRRRLEMYVFPNLGKRPIRDIRAREIHQTILKAQNDVSAETGRRAFYVLHDVLRYAVNLGITEFDAGATVANTLKSAQTSHLPAIVEPEPLGELLRAVDAYTGSLSVLAALKLLTLTMLRPSELTQLRWEHVDFAAARITLPPEHMKGTRKRKPHMSDHVVPLSRQAMTLLSDLEPYTNEYGFVFTSSQARNRPITIAALSGALARLGYKSQHCPHGFRKSASTILNESGLWSVDAIERQLAHRDRDQVRAIYNQAEHLNERAEMMQWLADKYDQLAATLPTPLQPANRARQPQLPRPRSH